jgi:glyoxylate/hydroxypyruvate reductase A
MSILLISTVGPMEPWLKRLREAFPADDVRAMPDIGDPAEVEIALVAHPDAALFRRLSGLKLVIGLRAGVDDLLALKELRPEIPVARAQEPDGDRMIAEYVLMHVLRHHRHMPDFVAAQARRDWINPGAKLAEERAVGFMGLGVIALSAARLVRDTGFRVAAWTRTAKSEPGIESFVGPEGLMPFLGRTEILVNLLAVTPETANIVDATTLATLPRGASFINVGRGEHVDDAALIAALDSRHLAHATLDVFRTEPLPKDHPFWTHPKITVMPHTARRPRAASIIPHAVENIRRFRAGQPLLQQVDRKRGY